MKIIDVIERVQRRVTKMVKECCDLSYVERLTLWKLPCLQMQSTKRFVLCLQEVAE